MSWENLAPVILEIAYLATGLTLCFVGKGLLQKGIRGRFEGEGKFGSRTIRIVTASPGILFMLAGLTVIAIAISQTATIEERVTRTVEGGPQKEGEAGLRVLLERVRVTKLAKTSNSQNVATQHYEAAKLRANQGEDALASTHLAIAITIDPSLLRNALEEPSLKKVIGNVHFQEITRARFELPLILEPLVPLEISPFAEAVLTRLTKFSEMHDPSRTTSHKSSQLVKAIPRDSGMEPIEKTMSTLDQLLHHDPHTLLVVLKDRDYSWMLEDHRVLDALNTGINRIYLGQ